MKIKKEAIGHKGVARKGFPVALDKNTEAQTIKVGEKFEITDYDESTEEYTLINISIGMPQTWFKVNQTELDFISRQNATK